MQSVLLASIIAAFGMSGTFLGQAVRAINDGTPWDFWRAFGSIIASAGCVLLGIPILVAFILSLITGHV